MDPNIRSFSQIEKFIKENPRQADAQAFEWQQFLKTNAATSPELYSMETAEEFYRWAQEHPEKNVDPSVWAGKEISDSYYYLRDQHEQQQMQEEGAVDPNVPQELADLPFLAASFLERPKIMQDDKDYQKIEERLQKEWLEKNPGKDFYSKEGLDYLHGEVDFDPLRTEAGEGLQAESDQEEKWAESVNVNLPKKTTLAQDAENAFRNNPKFKKKLERYDKEAKKIYKKKESDPKWLLYQRTANQEIRSRIALLEKNRGEKTRLSKKEIELKKAQDEIIHKDLAESVHKKHEELFLQKYPEKAKTYSKKVESEQGKQEAVVFHEGPTYIPSAPSPTENQAPQPPSSGRTSRGGVNRAIDGINRMARGGFQNPLGKKSRAVSQVGKTFIRFLATHPWIWIALGIATLSIFVFVIVFVEFSGGTPGASILEPDSQTVTPSPATEITPTIEPTGTITPTPAAL